jgi:hypothetical protein
VLSRCGKVCPWRRFRIKPVKWASVPIPKFACLCGIL